MILNQRVHMLLWAKVDFRPLDALLKHAFVLVLDSTSVLKGE
jgi:hypothetical protein